MDFCCLTLYSYEERVSELHTLVVRGRERRKGGQVDELIGIVAEGAIPASQRKWYLSVSMVSSLCIISLFSADIIIYFV